MLICNYSILDARASEARLNMVASNLPGRVIMIKAPHVNWTWRNRGQRDRG